MADVAAWRPASVWLGADARERLEHRLHAALARARAGGSTVLVSVSEALDHAVDPSSVVLTSRRAGEQWFCYEQPDRGGFALSGIGSVLCLEAEGPTRFADVARRWRDVVAAAHGDESAGPAGAGLTAVGGLAFSPDRGSDPRWRDFAPASLSIPEVSLARSNGKTSMTVNLAVSGDHSPAELSGRIERRLRELSTTPPALPEPMLPGSFELHSALSPAHYEQAVARAVQRIGGGALEKVVLARAVDVHLRASIDPGAIVGLLREAFPGCFTFAVGRGDSTFLGASPELLIRREGARASTVALAGSARRSADPAVDQHLAEQLLHSNKDREENAIVARQITRALRPHAVWVTSADDPAVVQVANIQHLAIPIRAQLATSMSVVELAALLHPTPAVGGEPVDAALRLIPALETVDRGWYAGPVGWIDSSGDGEFCVALRCALVRDRDARLFAGAGITSESSPAAELVETDLKLQALLGLLVG